MNWGCMKCEHENPEPEFPFGDDVICANCGAVHGTDWDYTSTDSMHWWVLGLKSPTEKGTEE